MTTERICLKRKKTFKNVPLSLNIFCHKIKNNFKIHKEQSGKNKASKNIASGLSGVYFLLFDIKSTETSFDL